MNVEQFCSDYGATVDVLPLILQEVRPDSREQLGYSLEEKLVWRRQAWAEADLLRRRQIEAIDGRLMALADAIVDQLGVDVREFLQSPEVRAPAFAR